MILNSSNTQFNQQILFEGNSLLNLGPITLSVSGADYDKQYVPLAIYNSLRVGRKLSTFCYAIESRTGTQILAEQLAVSSIKPRDILVYWEGTNDMYLNGLTGAQAFTNVTDYLTLALAKGAQVVIGTVAARDYSLDSADLMTRISDYNTLVRNNTALGYTVCDIGADSLFDTRADCSNATYYATDKIHMVIAGQDIISTLLISTISNLL